MMERDQKMAGMVEEGSKYTAAIHAHASNVSASASCRSSLNSTAGRGRSTGKSHGARHSPMPEEVFLVGPVRNAVGAPPAMTLGLPSRPQCPQGGLLR